MSKKNMKNKKQDNVKNNPVQNSGQPKPAAAPETVQQPAKTVEAADAVPAEETSAAAEAPAAAETPAAQTPAASDAPEVEETAAAAEADAEAETASEAEDASGEVSEDASAAEDASEEISGDTSAAPQAPEKSASDIRKEREALKKELEADRLEMKNRSKAVRKMRQVESRQRRTEIKNSVVSKQAKFRASAKEMSEDLKKLLSKDITTMKRKNKTRGAEIMAIFAKHNFYMGGFTPEELRTTLEDLGPTYVKIGQIMSSRTDMLPESYCHELEKLRQNVKPLDPAIARAVIEQETGKKIEEIYSEFNDHPLGSASIGQAHSGVLLDGTKVVTKVQRPLIADMMRNDFVLLKKIASALKTVNEGKEDEEEQIDLMSVIVELEKVTEEELDFRVEAGNTIFFKENCIEDEEKVSCPTVYPELTTERIMTMSFVDGYSVSKKNRLHEDGYDENEIGAAIIDNYLHQVLDVGTFHADPHQGNIMVSHGVPYWIDFGMIGRLTPANIKMIQDLILALIQTDSEALVDAALAMGVASPKTDRSKLAEDLDSLINRYMSVTNLDELDTAVLLEDVTNVMTLHHIKIPGEYTMLIRSIATIEGVIEQLCPELNLFSMITDKLLARAKQSLDIQQSLLDVGKDALSLSKKAARIPVLAADVLTNISKGRAKINLQPTGYEELMKQFTDMFKYGILALFSCVIFFGSCILCLTDIQPQTSAGLPMVAVVGFIFSITLGIYTVKKMIQKSK